MSTEYFPHLEVSDYAESQQCGMENKKTPLIKEELVEYLKNSRFELCKYCFELSITPLYKL
ncbi:hypothetical protein Riv7116_4194 [Rivularia sp. PCC 7116]|nr:hypothetical protein Riv7116_4194 [Rivularia sp. PCC 7116]